MGIFLVGFSFYSTFTLKNQYSTLHDLLNHYYSCILFLSKVRIDLSPFLYVNREGYTIHKGKVIRSLITL